jgi:hypothetical protein
MRDGREKPPRAQRLAPYVVSALVLLCGLSHHRSILAKYMYAGTPPSSHLVPANRTMCGHSGGPASTVSVAVVVPGPYFVESAEGLAAMLERVGMQPVSVVMPPVLGGYLSPGPLFPHKGNPTRQRDSATNGAGWIRHVHYVHAKVSSPKWHVGEGRNAFLNVYCTKCSVAQPTN